MRKIWVMCLLVLGACAGRWHPGKDDVGVRLLAPTGSVADRFSGMDHRPWWIRRMDTDLTGLVRYDLADSAYTAVFLVSPGNGSWLLSQSQKKEGPGGHQPFLSTVRLMSWVHTPWGRWGSDDWYLVALSSKQPLGNLDSGKGRDQVWNVGRENTTISRIADRLNDLLVSDQSQEVFEDVYFLGIRGPYPSTFIRHRFEPGLLVCQTGVRCFDQGGVLHNAPLNGGVNGGEGTRPHVKHPSPANPTPPPRVPVQPPVPASSGNTGNSTRTDGKKPTQPLQ